VDFELSTLQAALLSTFGLIVKTTDPSRSSLGGHLGGDQEANYICDLIPRWGDR